MAKSVTKIEGLVKLISDIMAERNMKFFSVRYNIKTDTNSIEIKYMTPKEIKDLKEESNHGKS